MLGIIYIDSVCPRVCSKMAHLLNAMAKPDMVNDSFDKSLNACISYRVKLPLFLCWLPSDEVQAIYVTTEKLRSAANVFAVTSSSGIASTCLK